MRILVNEKLSEHKFKTPEGYLICTDAILARTGKQSYKRSEVFGLDCKDADSDVEVDRKPEEVFADATLASFENKPLTVEHPDEDVNVNNHKDYAVGFVRDVKRGKTALGEDVILGTLVVTDAKTIEEIENGEHTDLSCGYDCDIEDEANPQQKRIRGNHVALCQQGRAGIARIVDSVKDNDKYEVGKVLSSISKYYSNDPGIEFVKKKLYENNFRDVTVEKVEGWKANRNIPGEYTKTYFLKIRNRKEEGYVKAICILYADDDDWKVKEIVAYTTGISNDSVHDVEPRQGEDKADFISRFMEETKEEYPDIKQRLAVAYSYWEKRHKKDSVKDKLVDIPQQMLRDFENMLAAKRIKIDSKGKTWGGRIHYQVSSELDFKSFCRALDEINAKMEAKNIPMTFNAGSNGTICTAGIDLDKMQTKDSVKDAMMYKGYKLEEAKYLHNEEIGAKIAIIKNGTIVGGADSYDEAKKKLDEMKSEKDLYYSDSIKDELKVSDIHTGQRFEGPYGKFVIIHRLGGLKVKAKYDNGKEITWDMEDLVKKVNSGSHKLIDSVNDDEDHYDIVRIKNGKIYLPPVADAYGLTAAKDLMRRWNNTYGGGYTIVYHGTKQEVPYETYDSMKKYNIYYKDEEGNNCIKVVRASSLEDAIKKVK